MKSHFTSLEEAWSTKSDYCDAYLVGGVQSERERAASQTAYGKRKNPAYGLDTLYSMCAEAAPKNFDYLVDAGSPQQVKEVTGMLRLCPKHPLAAKIRGYLGDAVDENQRRAGGRIFSDGTYRVGKGVQPGSYFVRTHGDGCYWEQTDANGNIIDNGFSNGLRIEISIAASAYSFTSSDCGEWRPVN